MIAAGSTATKPLLRKEQDPVLAALKEALHTVVDGFWEASEDQTKAAPVTVIAFLEAAIEVTLDQENVSKRDLLNLVSATYDSIEAEQAADFDTGDSN